MGSNFKPTGSYSNLTRLELERLRRADAKAMHRVLSIGDSGEGSENKVGPGLNIFDEPLATKSPDLLSDKYALEIPSQPGIGLGTLTGVGSLSSTVVDWVGPQVQYDASDVTLSQAMAATATVWTDTTSGLDFTTVAQEGDLLIVKTQSGGGNSNAVGVISALTATTLTCVRINNPSGVNPAAFDVDGKTYGYMIIRPNAARLFAAPWSGAQGAEQTFFMVDPTSTIHTKQAPTAADLAQDSLAPIISPEGHQTGNTDRSDAIFDGPSPRGSLEDLGYRVVLFPDDGTGTGPDLTHPIVATNPLINTTIPREEQQIAIDYDNGVVRLSVAPDVGSDIKPSVGCVDPTTGRLNLYAVFWAVGQADKGYALGLNVERSTNVEKKKPARIQYYKNRWWIYDDILAYGFFVEDSSQKPARFGVHDKASKLKHLTYNTDTSEWRMRIAEPPTEYVNEDKFDPAIGSRVETTIADSSFEPQQPGIVTPGTLMNLGTQGIRESITTILDELRAASEDSYGQVRLRKGRHVLTETLHIPPGVVLKGEGPQTQLVYRGTGGPVIKFGPNTPWGVYDYSWSSYSYTYNPSSLLDSVASLQVEGQDICWNSNKKVWGILIAAVTSDAVWFNEMRLDGTFVFPGNGIDIKNDATRHIFTATSTTTDASQQWHTPGHSPRLAYHAAANLYGAVWTVTESTVGNTSALQEATFRVTSTPTGDTLTNVSFTTHESTTDSYLNPSCAFNEYDPSDTDLRIVYAYYTPTTHYIAHGPHMQSLGTTSVISSTDVVVNPDGTSLIAFTLREHKLLGNTTTASGEITNDTPRRFQTSDAIDFIAEGVLIGSKLHHLNTAAGSSQGGSDYVITNVTSSYLEIQREESTEYLINPEGNIYWAISPSNKLLTVTCTVASGFGSIETVVDGQTPSASPRLFNAEMREPDFVRLSLGSGNILAVFQAFNTTAFLAKTTLSNFDEGINTAFYDANLECKSTDGVYREHVSTCSVLLTPDGVNIYPGRGLKEEPVSPLGDEKDKPLAAVLKSLGASSPLVTVPNVLHKYLEQNSGNNEPFGYCRGPHLEISARHLVHKWTLTQPMSLIPDVTWTEESWAIVSPTQPKISSDTGTIRVIGGQEYLVDPTFMFGGHDANLVDGNFLPRTNTYAIDFPDIPSQIAVAQVVSEHCVQLASSTGLADGTRVSWSLLADSDDLSFGLWDSRSKVLGFLVAPDGSLIAGSSYLTQHMPPALSPDGIYQRVGGTIKTVSRKNLLTVNGSLVSTGGGNNPSFWGVLHEDYDSSLLYKYDTWTNNHDSLRVSGYLGFQGICAGVPMPYGVESPVESPSTVAIAWGETFYALAMRQRTTTLTGSVNRSLFLRQSFGPYNAHVQDMTILGLATKGQDWLGQSKQITPMTRRHVLTRWGLPNSPAGGFATDGYRNCFVYGTQIGQVTDILSNKYEETTRVHTEGTIRWDATYTDAVGDFPIEFEGPTANNFFEYTQIYRGLPGNSRQLRLDTGYQIDFINGYPASPVVIWTGKSFVAFWTENEKSQDEGSYISMYAFPGDSSEQSIDGSLVPKHDVLSRDKATTIKVSCGLQITGDGAKESIQGGQVTVCDAAYSGNTFGVVWECGLLKPLMPPTLDSGTALGIAIFQGSGYTGSAKSYLIATGGTHGILDPTIVWDGENYVITYVDSLGQFHYVTVLEDGFGSTIQYRRLASGQNVIGETNSRSLGTLDADGLIELTGADNTCQAGDVVQIDKTLRVVTISSGTDGSVSSATNFSNTASTSSWRYNRITETAGTHTFNSLTRQFEDSSQTFTSDMIGSLFVVTSPSEYAGAYTITGITSATTIEVHEDFPVSGTNTVSTEYYIDMSVKPGDLLVITNSTAPEQIGSYTVKAVTDHHDLIVDTTIPSPGTTNVSYRIERRIESHVLNGPHVVTDYDTKTQKIRLDLQFSWDLQGSEVVGSILSGGVGSLSNLPRQSDERSNLIPFASFVHTPRSLSLPTSEPRRLFKTLVLGDQIVVLYAGSTIGSLEITSWNRRNNDWNQRTLLGFGNYVLHADMGYNGKDLLIVHTNTSREIQYALVNPSLNIVETGYIAQDWSTNAWNVSMSPIGTDFGQVPGVLHQSFETKAWINNLYKEAGTLEPRPKRVHVVWNSVLGRWVVSGVYSWSMEGFGDPSRGVSYENNAETWELSYYDTSTSTSKQPCDSSIGGGLSGRELTGRFYPAQIQPGMRLVFQTLLAGQYIVMTVLGHDPAVSDPAGGVEDVYTKLYVDVDSSQLTATELGWITNAAISVWAVHREDTFVWTLKQGEPAVQVVDATGCSLDNVHISGSLVDVSEQYTASATPIWRTSGELANIVGDPAPDSRLWKYNTQKRPYTRSFLVPSGTINMTNCKVRTPVKYKKG